MQESGAVLYREKMIGHLPGQCIFHFQLENILQNNPVVFVCVVTFFILVYKLKLINVSILVGIEVGDQFYSRAEMVALGIHSHWLKGIDYMGMEYQDEVILFE